jgi:hypothetical protein
MHVHSLSFFAPSTLFHLQASERTLCCDTSIRIPLHLLGDIGGGFNHPSYLVVEFQSPRSSCSTGQVAVNELATVVGFSPSYAQCIQSSTHGIPHLSRFA